jgi:hypothetical protein
MVLVEVPDEDAERMVRYLAKQLRAGIKIIVLQRPENIPDEDMEGLVASFSSRLEMASIASRVKQQRAVDHAS